MKNNERTIISSPSIDDKIASLFSDFVILDVEFNIISISQGILNTTGFSAAEVLHKPLSVLSATDDRTLLEGLLRPGYFEKHRFKLRCKNNALFTRMISGFCLGKTEEINPLIIIKFNRVDEIRKINNASDLSAEVDEFIYTTSHLLRGPLATLKGLINLASDPRSQKDMGYLLEQMSVFAERLDEKLHQLIYVAESDKSKKQVPENLLLNTIFQSLSASVQEFSNDFPVNFYSHVQDQQQVIEKGELVLPMLSNLVLFFCQQPKTERNQLVFDGLSSSGAIEIIFRSKGFLFDESLVERMAQVNFGYSQILNFPELINFYAAKKIMSKLNGSIQCMLTASDEMVVLMTVPQEIPLSPL